MTALNRQKFHDELESRRAQIERAMQVRLGYQTLCEIHKDGRVTGGLKYDEGQLVMLSGLLRRLKRAPDAQTPADFQRLLQEEHDHWERGLTARRSQAQPSLPWIAYYQGGVDACAALLAWLRCNSAEVSP